MRVIGQLAAVMCSDVKSWTRPWPRGSLEAVYIGLGLGLGLQSCSLGLGLGLVGQCLGLGLGLEG